MNSSAQQGDEQEHMPQSAENESAPKTSPWLVRIPEIFEGIAPEVLRRFGAVSNKRLGSDYYLIRTTKPEAIQRSEVAKFARWNLPMDHTWACHPQKMDGFVEKAAQVLWQKFGRRTPQGVFIGPLNAGSPDRYYKMLCTNLRGRVLQLFPKMHARTVEEQDAGKETLFVLLGKEGMFCGMQCPQASNGLYPGGSKYVSLDSPDTISRAGAKIAEALHYLLLHRPPLAAGSHWVELGASPGGMTSELLARGQRVTAIDRALLDKRLDRRPGLNFIRADVATFLPGPGTVYDAILSDLNGPPQDSIQHVIRLMRFLRRHGLVVFTLKLQRVESVEEPCELFREIVKTAAGAGLRLIAQTHLTYNRNEFTLFFDKEAENLTRPAGADSMPQKQRATLPSGPPKGRAVQRGLFSRHS